MDLLTTAQQRELLERLQHMSDLGQLTWEQQDEHHFFAESANFFYLLSCRDRDDQPPFDLGVARSGTGEVIYQLATDLDAFDQDEQLVNGALSDLYVQLKRKVLELDTLAEDLFADLEPDDPV